MGRAGRGKHRRRRFATSPQPRRRRSRGARITACLIGLTIAGGAAYAATSWVTGLAAGSSAEAQAASASDLTIAAVSSPSPSNLLYPGGTGDVVFTITNPNAFPVTMTGVDLPASTTYATGYTASGLTGSIAGCSAANSDVLWSFATSTSGSAHTLTSPLTVAAGSTLTVTLTNDSSMTTSSPAACESAYFSMPALTGIVATGGSAEATTSPATDSWTS